ncbi:MAG: hypothetical protein ACLSAF_19880 [Intestinimonas sp.]
MILKGGPGCGKSHPDEAGGQARRKSGDWMWVHATVPETLSPWTPSFIPQKKAAIVDGTAPHVVGPNIHGVVERLRSIRATAA